MISKTTKSQVDGVSTLQSLTKNTFMKIKMDIMYFKCVDHQICKL